MREDQQKRFLMNLQASCVWLAEDGGFPQCVHGSSCLSLGHECSNWEGVQRESNRELVCLVPGPWGHILPQSIKTILFLKDRCFILRCLGLLWDFCSVQRDLVCLLLPLLLWWIRSWCLSLASATGSLWSTRPLCTDAVCYTVTVSRLKKHRSVRSDWKTSQVLVFWGGLRVTTLTLIF